MKITRDTPHGLRYSLTLHDPIGTRMFRDAHQLLLGELRRSLASEGGPKINKL